MYKRQLGAVPPVVPWRTPQLQTYLSSMIAGGKTGSTAAQMMADPKVTPALPRTQPLDPPQIIREVNAVALECKANLLLLGIQPSEDLV